MDRISAKNVTGCNRCVKTYSLLENLCVSKCEKAVTGLINGAAIITVKKGTNRAAKFVAIGLANMTSSKITRCKKRVAGFYLKLYIKTALSRGPCVTACTGSDRPEAFEPDQRLVKPCELLVLIPPICSTVATCLS